MNTVAQILRWRCQTSPQKTAYLVHNGSKWQPFTWAEVDKIADKIAAGLLSLGLAHQDKISILGATQFDWAICDLAGIRAGGVTVGVYPTLTGEQSHYVIQKSESKFLFIDEESQFKKIEPYLSELPHLQRVILWQGKVAHPLVMSLDELKKQGEIALQANPELVQTAEARIKPEDWAIFIFTSGTTGLPKAAIVSHQNIVNQVNQVQLVDESDRMLFFLPLAHVAERVVGHYTRVRHGVTAAFVNDLGKVIEALQEIKPTCFGSVPRIFEKIYNKVQGELQKASPTKRKIFAWALKIGKDYTERQAQGKSIPLFLRLQYPLADTLVLKKMRNLFGGEAKFTISGAAPISLEILEFFRASGLLILEGYGLTETSGLVTMNFPDAYRFGSVGKALPTAEIKIAEDGEILVRGAVIFQGYFQDEAKTQELFTEDGWFCTGDIGKIDSEGFVYITGRKKDIIITSGGKNVTPSNIEQLIIGHPLIEQVLVHGDRRKYLTALLTLEPENAQTWAKQQGIDYQSVSDIGEHPTLRAEIETFIEQINTQLAQYETIKDFAILPELLSIEGGELTPTLKIKRNVVEQKYRVILDEMYPNG
jgi:long-chain acyl-CoA synthetase